MKIPWHALGLNFILINQGVGGVAIGVESKLGKTNDTPQLRTSSSSVLVLAKIFHLKLLPITKKELLKVCPILFMLGLSFTRGKKMTPLKNNKNKCHAATSNRSHAT
jgi:hypothetical protein